MTMPHRLDDPRSARTVPALIRAAAAAYGDAIAITLQADGVPIAALSFAELERHSADLARGLIASGVGKGARIGFLYGNGPAFAVTLAAIARIGAIAIPISTLLKAEELVRVLRQSDVAGLLVQRDLLGQDYVARLCDALPELRAAGTADLRIARTPYLRWIASSGADLPAAIRRIDALIAAGAGYGEDLLREIEAEVHPSDQAVEIYTSGSMALPKGVGHQHGPLLFRTHYVRAMIGVARGQAVNAWLPMFWVGGLMMNLLPNWAAGAVTVCSERMTTSSRIAMGSVLAPEDLQRMAGARPFWGLGMSETLGPYAYGDELRDPDFPLCAPMDHIADGYEVRVADADGRPVAHGEVGEIQVRGYALTPGLHKIERDGHFLPDGFYHTGDLGLVRGDRILFVGRDGDMIKTASSNVSPAEVEMEMQRLEGVHSAYVVGIPDRERGQLVVAAVVPRDGVELDFEAIQSELRTRLSSFKVPRGYVAVARDDVPMLASNKVARRQIETMLIRRLGRDGAAPPA